LEKMIPWIMLAMAALGNFAILVKMYVTVTELGLWREKKVDPHIADTEKHLDARRDNWRMDELQRRLERMERKLDTVLAFEAKKKGDTDE